MHSQQLSPISAACRCRSLLHQLLLAMVACLIGVLLHSRNILQVVHSQPIAGGYMSIEIGKAADMIAVAKLSQGPHQQSWWTLADTAWHDSAFERFFAVGPLRADEMMKLAAQNGKSSGDDEAMVSPWVRSGISNVSGTLAVTQALQSQLSTATYKMSKTVKGTGKIEAVMRTFFFRCRTGGTCDEGYMVPLVVTHAPKLHNSTNAEEEIQLCYGTLWLQATSTLLVNAIPSFINYTTPSQHNWATTDELAMVINVYNNIRPCPSKPAFVGYRSHLEASYGLLPGTTCILFDNFRLLLALSLPPNNVSVLRDDNSALTTAKFLEKLKVTSAQWQSKPFEDCSEQALLVNRLDDPDYLTICHEDMCVDSHLYPARSNFACNPTVQGNLGLQWLKFLQLVASLSESCSLVPSGEKLIASLEHPPTFSNVSCNVMAHVECIAEVGIYMPPSPFYLISRKSNWTISKGLDTSEFSQPLAT